ncbi:heat stress transcription factor C-1a-like [Oryza brachyantha]|uniref:HSF-type DNA-binding domain-containing protein n=1 Tax=Oryza brachyantha TaxID=4533 RepID=J3L221_ORYBR|nr:heat stress transcription factor C-1a-like [Oryza brachyantha]
MDGLHTELALGLIGGDGQQQTAPFVAKTYQMVCDPRTDALVRWGRENNSFVIVDPAAFSQLLLPCFFKHGNFSSFVRQLNTYGFRKVHPDRWEFAHESFLRGQTHLLSRIARRKKRGDQGGGASCSFGGFNGAGEQHAASNMGMFGEEAAAEDVLANEAALFEEVQRLRHKQTAIGEDLARMSQRLQATERRPDQLMSFLAKLADDPNAVTGHLLEQVAERKRRRKHLPPHEPTVSPLPPAPPPPQQPLLALAGAAAMEGTWQWTTEHQIKPMTMLPSLEPPTASCGVQKVPELGGGGVMGLTDGEAKVEPPFPFCLLGQAFF